MFVFGLLNGLGGWLRDGLVSSDEWLVFPLSVYSRDIIIWLSLSWSNIEPTGLCSIMSVIYLRICLNG